MKIKLFLLMVIIFLIGCKPQYQRWYILRCYNDITGRTVFQSDLLKEKPRYRKDKGVWVINGFGLRGLPGVTCTVDYHRTPRN